MKKYMETRAAEGRKNTKVNEGGKEYYQHLKELKNDNESGEYSVSFMMF